MMRGIIFGQWGMALIPFLAAVIWLVFEIYHTRQYASHLRKAGYAFAGRSASLRRKWSAFKTMRFGIGMVHQAHLSQLDLNLSCYVIDRGSQSSSNWPLVGSSALRRVGSDIRPALSLLLGLWEARKSREIWDNVVNLATNPVHKAALIRLKEKDRRRPNILNENVSIFFNRWHDHLGVW
jgi:hypothetical protein